MNETEKTLLLYGVLGVTLYIVITKAAGSLSKLFTGGLTDSATSAIQNAATGTLSDSEKQTLINQEMVQLIRAGMAPAQALAQATSDVNLTLKTQPGYFASIWDYVSGAI